MLVIKLDLDCLTLFDALSTAGSATARKLGVIIWTMIKKMAYKPPTEYVFLDNKRKEKLVERIKKNITKFDMKAEDFGFATH